ncbi:helix-turn-helix domain-containing protein [Plantactinospora sp. B5E13]|uniref:helix-turn-helix domain-containing protein n=1 Tax=unclassified Plantactinospora TaxID=2631981 RepID=UPI00325EEEB1
MRTTTVLVDQPDFRICAVRCHDDHTGWSAPEPVDRYELVLVRAGGFRRRGRTGEALLDQTLGYLAHPHDEASFAHPHGGDDCTALTISTALWHELLDARPVPETVYVDAELDLAHRLLRRAGSGPDPEFAAAERLVALLVRATGVPPAAGTPGNAARDRRVVEAAREALHDGEPAATGLVPLARLLDVSPYRLSRSFRQLVGVPLTRYRNRLRVGRALDRLEQGTDSLAALAADLGFADQAHLTRTVRAQLGRTPAELRRLLRPSSPSTTGPS